MTELNEIPACSKPLLPAVLSLFDGMSCGQIALERAGIKYNEYYASEIDKHAIEVTLKNYPKTKQIGSVTEVKAIDLPKIELLIGGSPCQSFSSVGNGTGFDGKSGLFWEYVRVLQETKPKYFLLENVVMKKEWENVITEALGVKPIKINSRLLSGQNRPRIYWTNIPNVTQPKDLNINLVYNDNYFNAVNPVPFVKRKISEFEKLPTFFNPYNKSDLKTKSPTLTATGNRQTTSASIFHYKYGVYSMANSSYWEALQTVPYNYTEGYSENIRKNLIGNGWTVDVIAHILSFIPQ